MANITVMAFGIGIISGILIGLKLEHKFKLYKFIQKRQTTKTSKKQKTTITIPGNINLKR